MIIVSILVFLNYGFPVVYTAERAGKNERLFKLFKFRSMSNEKDMDGVLLKDNLRLTKFGRILRSTSLDELPGLFNIIKGEMSFIGPRPLPRQYLPFYTKEEARRHSITPGLTGLAQVNGRNALGWEDKFSYDLQYVERISFSLDLIILTRTLFTVINRKNIGVRGEDAPEDFDKYRSNSVQQL